MTKPASDLSTTVLLVGPTADDAALWLQSLKQRGYHIATVASPAEAEQWLREQEAKQVDSPEQKKEENLQQGQSRLLEMIAKSKPLSTTLTRLLELIEGQLEGLHCTILLLDEDGVHMHPGAGPTVPPVYLNAVEGMPIGPSVGSCGTAMYRRAPVIVTDIETDPLWDNYRAYAHPHGLRACWSTPIILDDTVLGSFAMYYLEPRAPGPDEMRLIGIATHIAGIAIGRQRQEARMQRMNAELEARVNERTQALTASMRELEAFSYSVSHDLRAPLRKIDGFSQVLLDECAAVLDANGRDYLERIRSGVERMRTLIDDMLSLAQVSQRPMHRMQVDLTALAKVVSYDLQQQEPTRVVDWQISEALETDGDAGLLRIVLDNLLGNAWKFTRRSASARIEIGAHHRAGETVFFVRDNGVGFEASKAEKLFVAFQRFHAASEFEGTGIGLATVQRAIQRHGGRVWCESEQGKGTTLFFTLMPAPLPHVAAQVGVAS